MVYFLWWLLLLLLLRGLDDGCGGEGIDDYVYVLRIWFNEKYGFPGCCLSLSLIRLTFKFCHSSHQPISLWLETAEDLLIRSAPQLSPTCSIRVEAWVDPILKVSGRHPTFGPRRAQSHCTPVDRRPSTSSSCLGDKTTLNNIDAAHPQLSAFALVILVFFFFSIS
jgi:hypothetical protein